MFNSFKVVSTGLYGSSAPVEIDPIIGLSCTQSIGETKDIFSFKMPNSRGQKATLLQPFYVVNIYALVNTTVASSSNLIMSGLVKSIQEDKTDKSMLTINGISFGEVTTNALCFYAIPDGQTNNVMQFLQGSLNSVNFRDTIFNVTWDIGNPSVGDGSAFPVYTGIREFDRPLNYLLTKYLTDEYTGDGNYYWYVDNNRKLVIRKRIQTNDGQWTAGTDYKQAKFNINADDVKNFIVVKAGVDPNGRTVTERYDNPVSRAQYGFRYFLLVEQNICSNMIEGDKIKNPSKYTATGGNVPTDVSGFICSWSLTESSNPYTPSTVSDYLNQFRVAAKNKAYLRGKSFSNDHNRGFIQVQFTRPPEAKYVPGNIIQITDPSFVYYNAVTALTKSLINYPLRISDIQYDINSVLYTLMEDLAMAAN